MELKEFVKNVLKDLVDGVEEAKAESSHDMSLKSHKESSQTVEFDIAVTVEDSTNKGGKAGIKVFQLVEGGGEISREVKNSSVSRVKFGVYISKRLKEDAARSLNSRSLPRSRSIY